MIRRDFNKLLGFFVLSPIKFVEYTKDIKEIIITTYFEMDQIFGSAPRQLVEPKINTDIQIIYNDGLIEKYKSKDILFNINHDLFKNFYARIDGSTLKIFYKDMYCEARNIEKYD